MECMPHVVEASYVKDYLIKVKFDDGTEKVESGSPISKGAVS